MSTTPETATGNGAPTRHVACKLCRDRKVRCGGEQPACEKCKRAGEQCVYAPTKNPTKSELAQTVETLQKRLDEADAYIAQLKASSLNNDTLALPSPFNGDWPGNEDAQALLPSTSEIHQDSPQEQGVLAPFPVDNDMHMNMDSFWFQGQQISEETGTAILDPVTKFSSAIFRNQAEASVMASVVADYIAWLRKAPSGSGVSANESPVYVGLLETLETRLRELCDMSQSRSDAALRELVVALEAIAPPGGAMATVLGGLEEELRRETRERAEVFRKQYNPCALLSEQRRNMS